MKATKVEIEVLRSMADSLEKTCNMADYNSKLMILESVASVCYDIIKKYVDNSEIECDSNRPNK